MKQKDAVEALEAEWDEPEGFFFKLREGFFCEDRADRVLRIIAGLRLRNEAAIETRLVQWLWPPGSAKLPPLEIARERQFEGLAKSVSFETKVTNELEAAIGVP